MDILYYYNLYGLNVMSSFVIPDAENTSVLDSVQNPDVVVLLDSVPDFRTHPDLVELSSKWYYSIPDPQLFFMHCDGFDFEISNGRIVKVDTHDLDIKGSNLVTYILGSAFGVIGIQRGLVPIHGATIVTGDSAVIITGYSGSGKSAILSTLTQMGYRYLADDVSMVTTVGGKPFVFPSYPQRKIASVTASETGEDISAATAINEDGRDKFAIRKISEWSDTKLPLSGIVELVPVQKDDNPVFTPEIKEIIGQASLMLVVRNRYRARFADSIGTPPQRMKQLLEITSAVKTYQLIRPVTGFSVAETARLIERHCLQLSMIDNSNM